MTSSEIWFLRAEAALRGWTDEDEESCYRNGVITSFHQNGIYQVEDYLNSERMAFDFEDTYDNGNNIEAPESLIRKIVREESGNRGGTYHFTGQINRRVLFDEFISEAKLRQDQTGVNPLTSF